MYDQWCEHLKNLCEFVLKTCLEMCTSMNCAIGWARQNTALDYLKLSNQLMEAVCLSVCQSEPSLAWVTSLAQARGMVPPFFIFHDALQTTAI
uniref:Uncharacterized protein n=1 Tax=Timema poppense TaxID=170557 RepID=A0A7R9H0G8_TIMPO|nr:unnamed protein product [Timema poppensis]